MQFLILYKESGVKDRCEYSNELFCHWWNVFREFLCGKMTDQFDLIEFHDGSGITFSGAFKAFWMMQRLSGRWKTHRVWRKVCIHPAAISMWEMLKEHVITNRAFNFTYIALLKTHDDVRIRKTISEKKFSSFNSTVLTLLLNVLMTFWHNVVLLIIKIISFIS